MPLRHVKPFLSDRFLATRTRMYILDYLQYDGCTVIHGSKSIYMTVKSTHMPHNVQKNTQVRNVQVKGSQVSWACYKGQVYLPCVLYDKLQ